MRRLAASALLLFTTACAINATTADVAAAPAPASAGPTVAQLVLARRAGMHMAATLLYTDIRRVVESGADVRQHLHEPEGIARWGAAIPGLFPEGSRGDGRARPEIWADKADFDRRAAALEQAAIRLAQRGEAGDAAGYAAEARAVQAACTACHSLYRSD